jgi:CubicO group peptidase (beta-lactamase class C family)
MARNRGGTDFKLIEKIFDQLSSSVAIAMLKNDKLTYEFYGGRKAALPDAEGAAAKQGAVAKGFGFGKGGKAAGSEDGRGGSKKAAGRAAGKAADSGINRTTRFNIGSASSLFTGALAVKFMEFDELRLSDPVRRFIPEFVNDGVTIYHLLTHTSGLASDNQPYPENIAAKREFYKKLYAVLRLSAKPGARSEYFQYNYAILSDIIERLTGQTLGELAFSFLFEPLGMKHTTFNSVSLRDNQYVIPWNHKENRFMSEMHAKQPTGQNGAYATALDLVRFGRMFLNGGEFEGRTVFLESSVEFMLHEITGGRFMRTPLFLIKRKVDVFGCFSEQLSPEAVALTGDTGGILFIDPVKRMVGAALTNSTWTYAVNQNYSNIVDILTGI